MALGKVLDSIPTISDIPVQTDVSLGLSAAPTIRNNALQKVKQPKLANYMGNHILILVGARMHVSSLIPKKEKCVAKKPNPSTYIR